MKPFVEHDDMLSLVSRYLSSHIPSTTWTYVESSFILHRFHLHEFTYLLKFTWSSRINTRGTFVVICIYGQSGENSQLLTHMFPTEVKQGESLPSFSSHVSKTILFSLFSTTFLSFYWWLHCLKWPKYSADTLCSVRTCKKAVMHLTETHLC